MILYHCVLSLLEFRVLQYPYPRVPIPDNKLSKLLKYSYIAYYLKLLPYLNKLLFDLFFFFYRFYKIKVWEQWMQFNFGRYGWWHWHNWWMTSLVNVIRFYFNYHCYVDHLDFDLDLYVLILEIGKSDEVIEVWNAYEI